MVRDLDRTWLKIGVKDKETYVDNFSDRAWRVRYLCLTWMFTERCPQGERQTLLWKSISILLYLLLALPNRLMNKVAMVGIKVMYGLSNMNFQSRLIWLQPLLSAQTPNRLCIPNMAHSPGGLASRLVTNLLYWIIFKIKGAELCSYWNGGFQFLPSLSAMFLPKQLCLDL